MPLQDLTPQLRTRLSRLEFIVGLFVTFAALLLVAGLAYYVYLRAERKGWFLQKLPYFTFVENAAGLNVGDKVKLMGFDAGEITEITPMPPGAYYDVYIQFQIWEPYFGYLWDDSLARVAAADLFGKRFIEVTKGVEGVPTYLFNGYEKVRLRQAAALANDENFLFGQDIPAGTGHVARAFRPLTPELLQQIAALGTNEIYVIRREWERPVPTGIWNDELGWFEPYTPERKGYFLRPDESPALTERLQTMVALVQTNLPQVLALTNPITTLLTNATHAVNRAEALLQAAQPIATNLAFISDQIREPRGSLGDWLFPTNLNTSLTQTLATLQTTLQSTDQAVNQTDARLGLLVTNLNASLENLAGLTSNLNAQVQSNTNLVTGLNHAIVRLNEFIQGLKRHWLLRSAFKDKDKDEDQDRDRKRDRPKILRSPRDKSRQ